MKNLLRVIILFLMCTGIINVHSIKADVTDIRLALVSNDTSDNVTKLLDLAVAQLSSQNNLKLLERQEIEKILKEQSLSLYGIMDSAQAVKIGILLNVDIFAVVEVSPKEKQTVGLVIFESATGRRLWDVPLSGSVEASILEIVQGVKTAVDKYQSPPHKIKTLSLLPVRNAGLPRDLDSFCETVGFLFERRLTHVTHITVLERELLEYITKERSLPGANAPNRLLASLLRLEIEIAPHSDGKGLQGLAVLKDNSGKELKEIRAEHPGEISLDIVDSLFNGLLGMLETQEVGTGSDRKTEAQQFASEALYLKSHANTSAALRAMQAAYALDPIPEYKKQLIFCQLAEALSLLGKNPDKEELRYALWLIRESINTRYEILKNLVTNKAVQFLNHDLEWSKGFDFKEPFQGISSHLTIINQGQTEYLDEIEETLSVCRAFQKDVIDRWTKMIPEDSKDLECITNVLYDYGDIWLLEALAPDKNTFPRERVELGIQWLDAIAKYGIAEKRQIFFGPTDAELITTVLYSQVDLRSRDENGPERPPINDRDKQLRSLQIEKMKKHPNPFIAVYGQIAEFRDMSITGTLTEEVQRQHFMLIQQSLQQLLTNPTGDPKDYIEETVYRTYFHAIKLLCQDPKWRYNGLSNLWEFMLNRNRIHQETVVKICLEMKQIQLDITSAKILSDLIQKTLPLCDSPGNYVGNPYGKTALLLELTKIYDSYPQLLVDSSEIPWNKVIPLIEIPKSDSIGYFYRPPILTNEFAYTATYQNKSLKVMKIPLAGGPAVIFGEVFSEQFTNVKDIGAFCLDEYNFYVGSYEGLFIFPLNGGDIQRLTTKNGLPSNYVKGLASMNGTLYIGMGDTTSHMIAYNLKNRAFSILASNTRREKGSPFDNLGSFDISDMFSDPLRNRIVFYIHATKPSPSRNNSEIQGLWEFNPSTGKLNKLLDYWFAYPWGYSIDERYIMFSSHCITVIFDLKTDSARIVRLDPLVCSSNQLTLKPDSETFLTFQTCWMARECVIGDWIWISEPFCRMSRESKIQPLPTEHFGNIQSIQPIGRGDHVFIASERGMYLLNLHSQ